MTTLPPPRPVENLDDDPTGMSALLRGLPDPGPMPEELVQRIQLSLAAQTGPFARTASDETGYAPVLDLTRSRRSGLRPVHWAAAAGLVVVAGGGLLASQGSHLVSAFSVGGSAAGATMSAERQGSAAADVAGAPAAPVGSPVVVTASNRSVTGNDIGPAAALALGSGADSLPQLASEAPLIGPIATPRGARDCADALGIPADAELRVDLVQYDEQPAAVVVATTRGEHTAYLVRRSCRLTSPELMVGPQRL